MLISDVFMKKPFVNSPVVPNGQTGVGLCFLHTCVSCRFGNSFCHKIQCNEM